LHDVAQTCLVADDLVNHAAIPEAQGKTGLRNIMQKLLKAFPDARWSCQDVMVEGDRAACRVTMRGTNTGALEFLRFPMPATGKSCQGESLHMFRFVDGKVVEHWAGRDDFGLLRQLGHLPLAEAQS
jgi:lactoylglutathione lyase